MPYRLQCALLAWSGFLFADLVGMVNFLLKRAFTYGYATSLYTFPALSNDADTCLFLYNEHHCIHDLLPPLRASILYLDLRVIHLNYQDVHWNYIKSSVSPCLQSVILSLYLYIYFSCFVCVFYFLFLYILCTTFILKCCLAISA